MDETVRNLFHELLPLHPAERERIFAQRKVDVNIRRDVESLLNHDVPDGDEFTACLADAAAQILGSEPADRCGPYRLLRLLGSGGMGDVYLAEREGEIEQTVAVKLLAALRRPGWRERFIRERQLLASLNHASIVHVIDAGHTADGRPFLVMEYVAGEPIDVYAARIAIRERLALFLRVCEGVSHAHRHLIIHRDLKPSNILVDESGQPKLLDFGIAKLLDQTSDVTQTCERLLTPSYASPEQLRGELQTTATDIYSLGAVLCKLLTGQSPRELGAPAARPSRLNREVPPDLDFVIQKALRPEPEERYASVDAFAGDLRAVLASGPVAARAGDAWYRTRKFLRRYWIPVTASALVIASLLFGLGIANHERAIAQRRFSDVQQLANRLFDIDAKTRELPGSTDARQLIVDTALEYLHRLAADVQGDPKLALDVGNAYMRVARVQGVPISPTLGQTDEAEQNLEIANQFIQSALKAQPANRTAMLRAAQIAHDRMILARFQNHLKQALGFASDSAAWLGKYHAGKGDAPEASAILNTYLNVADQFMSAQRYEEALRLCSRGSELAAIFHSPAHRGNFLWVSALVFRERGQLDAALRTIQESARLLDPGADWLTKGGQARNFDLALIYEGRILGEYDSVSLGRPEEAMKPLGRAFRLADEFVHRDPDDHSVRGNLAMAGITLGDILRDSDPSRALGIFDHTLHDLAEVHNNVHLRRFEVNLLAGSSYALRRAGHPAEARRRLNIAFERLRQLKFYPVEKVYPGSEAQETLEALADYQAGTGRLPQAIATYENLLDRLQPAESGLEPTLDDAVHLSVIYHSAAALYRRAGRIGLARTLEAKRLALWQNWDRKLPNNSFVHRELMAAVR